MGVLLHDLVTIEVFLFKTTNEHAQIRESNGQVCFCLFRDFSEDILSHLLPLSIIVYRHCMLAGDETVHPS